MLVLPGNICVYPVPAKLGCMHQIYNDISYRVVQSDVIVMYTALYMSAYVEFYLSFPVSGVIVFVCLQLIVYLMML